MKNFPLIFFGKFITLFSRAFNFGSGSTWPGHIALNLNPNFIREMVKDNKRVKIVVIAGTNGKTTTSKLLRQILAKNGIKAFRNEEGANLLNGIASSLISHSSFFGKLDYDVAIFETDENALPQVLPQVNPDTVIVLNIFRDQLDRYGEVNTIAKKWEEAFSKLPKEVLLITNGDDPELSFIAKNSKLKSYFFGIDGKCMQKGEIPHDVDFIYCPNCNTKLKYNKISYSHMGDFVCPSCSYSNPPIDFINNLHYPLFGNYNIYNTNAAALAANKVFGVKPEGINIALKDFKAAFGRQETFLFRNKKILMLLSKNPAGFNQSIEAIKNQNISGNILLILNDRIPDGRDVSWIWDVDFEKLPKTKLFIAGDRSYDMAIRIKYGMENQKSKIKNQNLDPEIKIFENLNKAINEAAENTNSDQTLVILSTYSGMLDARKVLTGKKIL